LLMLYKNLPSSRVNRILFIRMVLDGLAALSMLAKGDVKNFKSVFKAHKDFKALKKKFVAKREKEVNFADAVGTHDEIYRRSIVVAYYLRGIRKFRNLNWK
ncbi:MAG: glycosyltransferase family 2 protein, partial [Paludibacteraceae bacterium]|nr:glycosyltransferase family 2 protein [Paludibacteraceae bacterium]